MFPHYKPFVAQATCQLPTRTRPAPSEEFGFLFVLLLVLFPTFFFFRGGNGLLDDPVGRGCPMLLIEISSTARLVLVITKLFVIRRLYR